ncbi:MAG TPA: hypothetical protein VIO60_04845 [Rectinemataceae bacterium]
MSVIYNPSTGLDIGDPDRLPFGMADLPSSAQIAEAAKEFILSASGWRKVFAFPGPGDAYASWSDSKSAEDSLSSRISPADMALAALAAEAFGKALLEREAGFPARAIVGIDSRPTGPAIADIFCRVLLGMGIEPRYCFIIAAPELMAYAGACAAKPRSDEERAGGFAYISASHNPPGHNGIKFGLGSGGVLGPAESTSLIASFKAAITRPDAPIHALELVSEPSRESVAACFRECGAWKRRAVSAYTLFNLRIMTDEEDLEDQAEMLEELAQACGRKPLGIVAELNGSARCLSIDRDFLEGIGVRVILRNDTPGKFSRRIVPEGSSLEPCMRLLDEAHAKDECFILGYAPDCDGDRGNLVVWDEARGSSRALEAQEVFFLSCLAELSCMRRAGVQGRIAVVVNDATSMRIEWLARRFGASVFRAETGEANVVALAESLRAEGWTVRILGEGSNGGTIVHPSRVRDPLSTVGAIVRLLRLPDAEARPSPWRIWMEARGETEIPEDYNLDDILATLPPWASTSVFEPRAGLTVRSTDKGALKEAYARIFEEDWEERKSELGKRYGISSYAAFASLGAKEVPIGLEPPFVSQGGLRIVFYSEEGEALAHLWMRGSGTEPVFRIQADVAGGYSTDEAYFLDWHASMARRADEVAAGLFKSATSV